MIKIILILIFLTAFSVKAQWETDIRLTNNDSSSVLGGHRGKCIAATGDTIHVVWYDKRDGNAEIYYKRSVNGGAGWEADLRLTNDTAISGNPSISASGDNVNIFWTDSRDGNYEVYCIISKDGGSSWGNDKRLTNTPIYSVVANSVADGKEIHLVWREYNMTDKSDEIYYKSSSDAGETWGNAILLSDGFTSAYNPVIAKIDPYIFTGWESAGSGMSIFLKTSSDNGVSWSLPKSVSENSNNANLPQLISTGERLYLVWNDYISGYDWDIFIKYSDDYATTWSKDIEITKETGNSKWASIAASGDNTYIVWEDDRNSVVDVFIKSTRNGGQNWSFQDLFTENNVTGSLKPNICISGSTVHVIWQDMRDGPKGEIYYKRNPKGNSTGIEISEISTEKIKLYPNPFKSSINIEIEDIFNISEIKIFNELGSLVRNLIVDANSTNKSHVHWDGLDDNGNTVKNGVYYCRIIGNSDTQMKKLILIR